MKISSLVLLATLGCSFGIATASAGIAVGIRIGRPAPIIIHRAPPHHVEEHIVIASPGPGYAWIPGHYSWVEGQWVWLNGAWVMPPQPGAVWVAGRWDGGSQTWIENHWEVTQTAAVADAPTAPPALSADAPAVAAPPPPEAPEVVVEDAPPPPQQEVIVHRPGRGYVWVGGYWGWHGGRRVWVPGNWVRPPHRHAHWVAPRWEHRGHGYVFIQGYWH